MADIVLVCSAAIAGVIVRDVHVAAALFRDTHWAQLNLWPTDLPQPGVPTRVMLSANDNLVPVQEVATLLTSGVAAERGVAVTVFPGVGHGSFLVDKHVQDAVMATLTGDAPVSESLPFTEDSNGAGNAASTAGTEAGEEEEVSTESVKKVQAVRSVHGATARCIPVAWFACNNRKAHLVQVGMRTMGDDALHSLNASTSSSQLDQNALHASVPVGDVVSAGSEKRHVRLVLPRAAPISGLVRILRNRVFNRARPMSSTGNAKPRPGSPR